MRRANSLQNRASAQWHKKVDKQTNTPSVSQSVTQSVEMQSYRRGEKERKRDVGGVLLPPPPAAFEPERKSDSRVGQKMAPQSVLHRNARRTAPPIEIECLFPQIAYVQGYISLISYPEPARAARAVSIHITLSSRSSLHSLFLCTTCTLVKIRSPLFLVAAKRIYHHIRRRRQHHQIPLQYTLTPCAMHKI